MTIGLLLALALAVEGGVIAAEQHRQTCYVRAAARAQYISDVTTGYFDSILPSLNDPKADDLRTILDGINPDAC